VKNGIFSAAVMAAACKTQKMTGPGYVPEPVRDGFDRQYFSLEMKKHVSDSYGR